MKFVARRGVQKWRYLHEIENLMSGADTSPILGGGGENRFKLAVGGAKLSRLIFE